MRPRRAKPIHLAEEFELHQDGEVPSQAFKQGNGKDYDARRLAKAMPLCSGATGRIQLCGTLNKPRFPEALAVSFPCAHTVFHFAHGHWWTGLLT